MTEENLPLTREDRALIAVRHYEKLFAENLMILADLEAATAADDDRDSRLWHRRNLASALVDYYCDELKAARLELYAAKKSNCFQNGNGSREIEHD